MVARCMTIGTHFRIIWRRRSVVFGSAILIAVMTIGASSLLPKVYRATAQVSVNLPTASSGAAASQTDVLFYTKTYAQLASTSPVLGAAASRSGPRIDEQAAAKRLTAVPSSTVGLISVSATGSSMAAATRLAAAESSALLEVGASEQRATLEAQQAPLRAQLQALQSRLSSLPTGSSEAATDQAQINSLTQTLSQGQLQASIGLTVVSPAQAASTPVSPKPKTWALLAFVTALIVGAELAVGYELLGDRFSPEQVVDDVGRATGLPVLAQLAAGRNRRDREAFQLLMTTFRYAIDNTGARTCAVLGESGVGRTAVAAGLAVAATQQGNSVALIDADLRHPALARAFKLREAPGLHDVLLGAALGECVQAVEVRQGRLTKSGRDPRPRTQETTSRSMAVVTAGRPLDGATEAISDRFVKSVVDELTDTDLVFFDTAAMGAYPDAIPVALACDTAVLVVDMRLSRRRDTTRALEQLRQIDVQLAGVVVNRVRPSSRRPLSRRVR